MNQEEALETRQIMRLSDRRKLIWDARREGYGWALEDLEYEDDPVYEPAIQLLRTKMKERRVP